MCGGEPWSKAYCPTVVVLMYPKGVALHGNSDKWGPYAFLSIYFHISNLDVILSLLITLRILCPLVTFISILLCKLGKVAPFSLFENTNIKMHHYIFRSDPAEGFYNYKCSCGPVWKYQPCLCHGLSKSCNALSRHYCFRNPSRVL